MKQDLSGMRVFKEGTGSLTSWLALGDRISGFCDLVWGRGASSYELLPRKENGR